jgi:biopolymer transport protein ExbB
MAITGGIGEALIATAAGLCVAIFALVVHTVFAQKMDDILTVIEKADAIISSEGRRRGI